MTGPQSTVVTTPTDGRGGDFLELTRLVRSAGLFHRPRGRSEARVAVVATLFAAGWAAVLLLGDSWYQLLVAAGLAVVYAQIAFLGHDIGHRQIFRSRRRNSVAGLIFANLTSGISYGYWVDKHDRHHAHPNQVGADPDVAPGVIAWNAEQTEAKGRLGRVVARHQAVMFFPLLFLEGGNLQISSIRALRTRAVARKRTEMVLLAVHAAWYLGVLFAVLSPLRAVVFLLVQQGLFGLYLGCAFAPNHKGMAMPATDQKLTFIRRQVTTSRNVRGGRLLDVAMGGLNYQIEHHLFPSMPMANLRRCQPMVRAYCQRHDIDYCEAGIARSYLASLRHLRHVGRRARPPAMAGG